MSVFIDTVTAADPASAPAPAVPSPTVQEATTPSAKPDMDDIRQTIRRDDERRRRLWAD